MEHLFGCIMPWHSLHSLQRHGLSGLMFLSLLYFDPSIVPIPPYISSRPRSDVALIITMLLFVRICFPLLFGIHYLCIYVAEHTTSVIAECDYPCGDTLLSSFSILISWHMRFAATWSMGKLSFTRRQRESVPAFTGAAEACERLALTEPCSLLFS